MSSLNVQSLLLGVVCAQLFALGMSALLYPYGTGNGDAVVMVGDDVSAEVALTSSFKYYGVDRNTLWVGTNGIISFIEDAGLLLGQIPADDHCIIAPYMCDLNTERNSGRVYYRQLSSGYLLDRATNHVKQCNSGQSSFAATWVFIATYNGLTYYSGDSSTPVSTFQVVLITNGVKSFVMFNYDDVKFAKEPTDFHYCQMGFNKGDGSHYTVFPDSNKLAAKNVDITTNCSPFGRWFFRVDGSDVEFGGKFPYGVYDCADNSPCTQANRNLGKYFFAYVDKTKYVRCNAWGACWIRPCAAGTVFKPQYSVCGWP